MIKQINKTIKEKNNKKKQQKQQEEGAFLKIIEEKRREVNELYAEFQKQDSILFEMLREYNERYSY